MRSWRKSSSSRRAMTADVCADAMWISYSGSGRSSPGHDPVSRAAPCRAPWSTRPRTRRKIAPSITSAPRSFTKPPVSRCWGWGGSSSSMSPQICSKILRPTIPAARPSARLIGVNTSFMAATCRRGDRSSALGEASNDEAADKGGDRGGHERVALGLGLDRGERGSGTVRRGLARPVGDLGPLGGDGVPDAAQLLLGAGLDVRLLGQRRDGVAQVLARLLDVRAQLRGVAGVAGVYRRADCALLLIH